MASTTVLAVAAPRPVSRPPSSSPRGRRVLRISAVAAGPARPPTPKAAVKVPRSIDEVDNGKVLGFSSELSEDHPGFQDSAYKQRRMHICDLARAHRIGEPIPRIEYTADEVVVWGTVLQQLRDLLPQHACKEFLRCWQLFDFRADEVPQLEDLSQVLQAHTGFRIRPVAGLLHPRDFLNGLAFKTFHSTQYMRHVSRPDYTPEPDVVHEVIGHVPMLADPDFANLVQLIGIASLGADEKQIWHLTKLYWYSVEFGVVREGDDIKAFGAGILSSFGELRHMAAGGARLEPLDVFQPQPKMSYKDGYQQQYAVLDSFAAGAEQLKAYCATLHHTIPLDVRIAVGLQ
ncbi:Tryptophan 5-hydroxylase 1 [Chlorella vulgaris]